MAIKKIEINSEKSGKKFSSQGEASEVDAWLQSKINKKHPKIGKPAREVELSKADEFEKSREESRRTEQDEEGNDIVLISVPADYTIVETDVTSEVEQKEINEEKKKFLADSDYKVIKHRDQLAAGESPSLSDEEYQALLAERKAARDVIIE